jgi:hypothetical protein
MKRRFRMMSFALIFPIIAGVAQQPSVHLQQPNLQGSRPLETQTQASVVRDYLESWKGLQAALDKNQAALLDSNFVGTARDKLANTIDEQMRAGIHTRYQARAHELQFVFYSPDGSSIQLIDTVDYDEQVVDHDKVLASKPMHERYVVVMTPSEVRWRVRLFQSEAP